MTFEEVIPYAKQGKYLKLPNWKGYFYWNYSTNELNFKNGSYHIDFKQILDKDIINRNDWYYIL